MSKTKELTKQQPNTHHEPFLIFSSAASSNLSLVTWPQTPWSTGRRSPPWPFRMCDIMSVNSSRLSGLALLSWAAKNTRRVWRTLSNIRNTFESSSSLAGWSDYLHLCHSVVNTAQGRKRPLKRLHFDWAGPRVLVGRSVGKAVEKGQRGWTALIFQSNTGHFETWWEQVTPHSQIRVTLLSQQAGEGRRRQLEASEQRRAPRPSAEVGTPRQRCSGSGEKWG